jgi:hypothetical protein
MIDFLSLGFHFSTIEISVSACRNPLEQFFKAAFPHS